MTHHDTKPEALRLAQGLNNRQECEDDAADELRRLHAECESLRTQLAAAQTLAADRLEQMTADRAQALRWRDEAEALRADARRYRWLIDGKRGDWCWNHVLTEEQRAGHFWIEEAINAAMGAMKEGE